MTEHMTFGALTIAYDERVLRPREWTTTQSEWAADLMVTAPGGPVLELCAGAGQIGLLAVAISGRRLVCVDADGVACDYARANAVTAGLADWVEVREARLEEAVADDERFPVVIADPPWVSHEETVRYPDDPLTAIDGGDDGPACASSTPTCPPAAAPFSSSGPWPRPRSSAASPASPRAGWRWWRSARRPGACSPASTGPEGREDWLSRAG